MTYEEMIFDSGIYLSFFIFGLVSGMFVAWVEAKAGRA